MCLIFSLISLIYFPYHFPIFSDMCLIFSLIFPIYFPYHFPIFSDMCLLFSLIFPIYFPYHFPIFSDMCLIFSLIFPIYFPYHFPILHRHPKVMGNFELRGQPFAGQVASLTVVTWMLRGLELVSEAKSDDFIGRGQFFIGDFIGYRTYIKHIPSYSQISENLDCQWIGLRENLLV